MTYDFMSLSPEDFERLVRDLLSAEWGAQLEAFKSGRDGGIDLRHSRIANYTTVIVQCKRYAQDQFNNLLASVKREVPKIERIKPTRYVLITSVPLSPPDKEKLLDILSPWCHGTADIFGASEVNGLLVRNPQIERAHFKLWISSSTVLSRVLHSRIFNLSEDTQEQLREEVSKLVVHDGLETALGLLRKFRHVLIVGNPGIGKTTLARMLACHLAIEEYEPLFISGNVADAWSVIEQAIFDKKKFVIIHDDFLGQLRFGDSKFEKNEERTLLQLIDRVRRTSNLRLILTTREYILADARRMYGAFDQRADEVERFTLKLSDYSHSQRARVLFNHLYFSDLPTSRLNLLVKTKTYKKIVEHEFFSPRIVETICRFANTRSMSDLEFIDHAVREFDDPRRLWDHPFRNQISVASQQVAGILWSFNGTAALPDMQASFNRINSGQSREETSQSFLNALKELDGNFIATDRLRVVKDRQAFVVRIRFQNPSVNEYVDGVMQADESRLLSIAGGITSFSQFSHISSLAVGSKWRQKPSFVASGDLLRALWASGCRTLSLPSNRFANYSGQSSPQYLRGESVSVCRRYELMLRLAIQLKLGFSEIKFILDEISSVPGWQRAMARVPFDNSEAPGILALVELVVANRKILGVNVDTVKDAFEQGLADLLSVQLDSIWIGDIEQLTRCLLEFDSRVNEEIGNQLIASVNQLAEGWSGIDDKNLLESEAASLRDLSEILPSAASGLTALATMMQERANSATDETDETESSDSDEYRFERSSEGSNIDELFALLAER